MGGGLCLIDSVNQTRSARLCAKFFVLRSFLNVFRGESGPKSYHPTVRLILAFVLCELSTLCDTNGIWEE